MSQGRFRVIVITRRRLAIFLFLAAAVLGMWTTYVREVAPASAPSERSVPRSERQDAPPAMHVEPDGLRPDGGRVAGAPRTAVRSELSPLRPVREVPSAKGMMAFTINVDWGNDELVQILDVLDDHGVKATFFLTGRWAKLYPQLAREIAERGHEIGNHGLSHAHPTQLTRERLVELIAQNTSVLKESTGVAPVPLFAPPYGEQNERVVQVAAEHGYFTTLWTLDTIDWQDPAPETILQRIVPRARDGAIVLMHPKLQTLQALPRMITGLKEQGFTLVPLWQMMQEE